MQFFESQEKAKKQTAKLVGYFILAVVLIVICVNAIVIGALLYLEIDKQQAFAHHFDLQISSNPIINLIVVVSLTVSPIVVGFILLATLFKMIRLHGGGVALANMLKAKPLENTPADFNEKQLRNIVEEMSIASNTPIPKLFVMENEEAINAFVAGNTPDDMVMVVTRGALNKLTRDELQGVIGHEYSHIFNSDMKINLRLVGILGGIFFLSQLGYFMLRFFSYRGRSAKKSGKDLGLVILMVGLGLFILGYIGLFFGRLIKASISRQRELLADAASVQYTRNPQGLINALRRIEADEKGSYLKTQYVEDISHLCFSSSRALWLRDLLATHPPLAVRIKLLDPQGQFSQVPLRARDNKQDQA